MKKKNHTKSTNIEKLIGGQKKGDFCPPGPLVTLMRARDYWEEHYLPFRIVVDNGEFRVGAVVHRRMRKLISPVAGKKAWGPVHGS